MVSRLFPTGIIFAFERRPYKLGETIDPTVELVVKGGEIMYHLGGRALRCGV